jgi:predicted O-methyltransferase YrrM
MIYITPLNRNISGLLIVYSEYIIRKAMRRNYLLFISIAVTLVILSIPATSQSPKSNPALDEKVQKFLDSRSRQWRDMNVPGIDGKLLHDIIVKNNYKSALEIGTSTGHSGIWIAWALSKTGGKLITIDIDEGRHKEALQNFKEAGLSDYIDARLADAHVLVKQLKGPFDFVFSDADKDWYKNYFIDVDPKLKVGGCFTAHNIYDRSGGYGSRGGQGGFLDHVKSLPNYETTVNSQGGGVSISYKKSEK